MRKWVAIFAVLLGIGSARAETPGIRVGLLAFGTAQWEIEAMRSEGLDKAHGFRVLPTEAAGKDGTSVALMAGSVDAIIGDFLWVARQRAQGHDLTFIPWSTMTGAVLVPPDSPVRSLADLKGRKIGIVGGPLDKSWLLLRAAAAKRHGFDLDGGVEKVFGAPPLLAAQLEAGRIDALLTFWQGAVPLEAKGMRRAIEIAPIPAELGLAANPPLVGWIMRRDWADANRATIKAFVAAEAETRARMCAGEALWGRLDAVTKAETPSTRAALRQGFCAAIPKAWGGPERQAAGQLFQIMAQLGGPELVGPGSGLDPATFWPEIAY